MTITCRNGTLANRFLPFPLSNVSGEARLAGGVCTLTARPRPARGDGRRGRAARSGRPSAASRGGWTLSATRVPITREMRPRLPEALRKLHVMLDPTGVADVRTAVLESEPAVEDGVPKQRWELRGLDVTVEDGAARPEKFPYPVRDVRGTAKTDADGVLRLDFRGTAGGRPGRFTGSVVDCGRRCGFEGEAVVAGLPLDRAVRDACPPQVAAALENLRFSGVADARLTLSRARGENTPTHWTLAGPVTGGRARPAGFPYELRELSGRVAYDSRDRRWRFDDLRGRHGAATLEGRGVLTGALSPPRLDLALTVRDVPLDRDLRAALPPGPLAVWDLVRPAGTADADLQLAWVPGEPVWAASRRFRVTGGTANLTAFPLPLRNVTVAGSYAPGPEDGGGAVTIDGFSAKHRERTPAGEVDLLTTGSAVAEHRGDGGWRVKLDGLKTDGLTFGPALRAAVPQGLRDGLDAVNLRGPVNLRVRELELRGLADDAEATTAAWEVAADLTRNLADLGPTVRLTGGRVACGGQYDGQKVTLDGVLRSPRADLLDHTLTAVVAPFRLRGDRLVVGTPAGGRPPRRGPQHASADAYGGVVRLDADADLAAGPRYDLRAGLDGLSLRTYADRHLGGSDKLEGSVKAVLNVRGRGADLGTVVGNGAVDVEPAALGELGVVMRLFGALGRKDSTMFDYAGAQFRVRDRTADFSRIELRGQAISFRGRGTVDLDGRLGLEFYSQPPARWNLPILGALSTGWVRLAVGGTIARPRVDAGSPALDAPLKAFLSPLLIDGGPPRTAVR